MRAAPLTAALSVVTLPSSSLDSSGFWYAVSSGALASGVGYALWYTALCGLKATSAATAQLSVPILTAVGGIVYLDEAITLRLLIASTAILGGIALVIIDKQPVR
ncbi:MAG: EamA family transporter [Methylococcales bacterium]|nr:EamA family transporter [Methylococcales bacterium]